MSSFDRVRPHVFTQLLAPPSAPPLPESMLPPPPVVDLDALVAEAVRGGQQRGYAAGFEQGLTDGQKQAQATLGVAAERLASLVGGARQEADHFLGSLERQVLDLALAVAARVIEREARSDPELVLAVLRGALAEMADAASVCVRVNPVDCALVEQHLESMLRRDVARNSQVTADERVPAGSCLIETQLGLVDAQLSTKLAQIADRFEAIREGEPL